MAFQPEFLGVEDVLQIHADQVALYGGSLGVRDEGLLLSALAQPMAGIGDEYFHPDLAAMAAAYVFHLVKNHPFVDGNKRVGYASARTFLELNGYRLAGDFSDKYGLVIGIAEGRVSKDEAAKFIREQMVRRE
ncbi:MAG: type II toxin-antitoxin system death-on-curing family toxin [bacterium]